MWTAFKNELYNKINLFVPQVKSSVACKKKWWTRPLDLYYGKIAKKHRLWTRYIETRDQNILSQYKSMRNTVRQETRKLHRLEHSAIASQCKMIQKIVKYIDSKRKITSHIEDLKFIDKQGVEDTNGSDEEKADILGKYFAAVFTAEGNNDDYNKLPSKTTKYPCPNLIFSKEKISDKLKDLNTSKSPGPDLIHPKNLWEIRDEIHYKLYLKLHLD